MKKIFYTAFYFCSALLLSSCIGDLDQYPHEDETAASIYTSAANYKAVLGKIYTAMVTTGQEKSGDPDLSSNSGQDYMRCFFNLQECGTDEVASTWLSGDNVTGLTYLSWMPTTRGYRICITVFITTLHCAMSLSGNATDEKLAQFTEQEQSEIRHYRAEARFMRALFYYHALDLYRNIPFVTENDPTSGYLPPRYTAAQIFSYIESELNSTVNDMLDKANCPYGRASQGAAYTLLAKLYLNAEVYTNTSKYTECISACQQAIAQGYSLEDDYSSLFNADNDKRTANEIIFTLPVDATHTVSWGSSTYIICGAVSNTSDKQVPEDYGVKSGWGMFRVRGEIPALFTGEADQRYLFFTDGQTQYLNKIDDQSNGFFVTKWTNLTDNGQTASNTADGGVNTDYPLFRLADVYLMMAEAVVRGGTGSDRGTVLGYINELQRRAYGDDEHKIADSDLTLDFLLKERARELYWEGHRRTDLIRYGMFTTDKYLWRGKAARKAVQP